MSTQRDAKRRRVEQTIPAGIATQIRTQTPSDSAQALRVLLAPPRGTNTLSYDALRECFVLAGVEGAPGTPIRGLTRLLARAFYPTYVAPIDRHDAVRWHGSGVRRGTRVDRELAAAVNAPARFSLESAHRFTATILALLARKGMTLAAAQVPIYDAHIGVATAIDLVAVRAGRIVLLEIKCGFEG